jgi:hypothetical protein
MIKLIENIQHQIKKKLCHILPSPNNTLTRRLEKNTWSLTVS